LLVPRSEGRGNILKVAAVAECGGLIWSTKNREHLLPQQIRSQVFEHIKDNARQKGIFLDAIGGHTDHVHALVSLGLEQNISKVAQLLKGESSHWFNQNSLSKFKLERQDEYFALSVSESNVDAVREYIRNQEEHHLRRSFADDTRRRYGNTGFLLERGDEWSVWLKSKNFFRIFGPT
jgi:putative transposase